MSFVCGVKYAVIRLVGMCNFFVVFCGVVFSIARRRAVCFRNASLASALGIPSATVIFFCVGTLNTLVLRFLRTGFAAAATLLWASQRALAILLWAS